VAEIVSCTAQRRGTHRHEIAGSLPAAGLMTRVTSRRLLMLPITCVLSRDCTTPSNTHTHTHTHPFNGPLSGTTQVGRYQNGKTNLGFTEARDSEWQWHQLGRICKSAPRSRQTTTPTPHRSVFYRPDALPAAQPTASEH